MAVRVLISDGSSAIRDAIRRHLECIGCDIVAEAATASQTLTLFRTIHPEVLALGVDVDYDRESDPVELIRLIKREAPQTSILTLTRTLSEHQADVFRMAGALECFIAPFDFGGLWRTLSSAHPELMAGSFAAAMSATAAIKASRISR